MQDTVYGISYITRYRPEERAEVFGAFIAAEGLPAVWAVVGPTAADDLPELSRRAAVFMAWRSGNRKIFWAESTFKI